jgi:hypothetical protein
VEADIQHLRVDFDDGDHLHTRFNGSVEDACHHYFAATFTAGRDVGGPGKAKWVEWPRRVTTLTFHRGGRIERSLNRDYFTRMFQEA